MQPLEQQQRDQHPQIARDRYLQNQAQDEIDMFELWDKIWSQRQVVALVTLLCVLGAALYIFREPKTYETETLLSPPEKSSLTELNIPGVDPVSPDFAYNAFLERLSSPNTLLEIAREDRLKTYFYEKEDVSDINVLKAIRGNLKITLPEEPKNKLLVDNFKNSMLVFQAKDAELSYTFVKSLIEHTDIGTKIKIKGDILAELNRRIENKKRLFALRDEAIKKEITSEIERLLEADRLAASELKKQILFVQKKAEQDRSYRITRLEESLAVAKKLGITTPVTPFDYQRSTSAGEAKIDIANRDPVGYWLGSKILSAEVESLRSREDDSPFIGELTELRKKFDMLATNERVEFLKNRQDNVPFHDDLRAMKNEIIALEVAIDKIAQANFAVFKYNQQPLIPTTPIKSKKVLVLAVATILGLMLGIFIALIRSAILNRSAQTQVDQHAS
jgi:LPS O-antigen subunit length determinant protein (WzzB/FepE family)